MRLTAQTVELHVIYYGLRALTLTGAISQVVYILVFSNVALLRTLQLV